MQNIEVFYNQSFFPTDKALPFQNSLADRSEQEKNEYLKQETPESNFKILVFSREKDTRILLKTLFQLWGYTVENSDSTADFWSAVEKQQPQIILVDSFLPFESSLKFVGQIRQNEICKKIPVVFLAGFPKSSHQRLSLEAGAGIYFEKPADFNSLEKYLENKSAELLS